jgi:hypothetical protein
VKLAKNFIAIITTQIIIFSVSLESANAVTPVQTACHIVKGWPDDYVKLWPKAVAWHNKAPDKNQASDYMKNYIETYVLAFKIKDKKALNIIQGYEVYWGQLESDIIHNNGQVPKGANVPSTKVLSMLFKLCSSVKDY